MLSVVLAFSVLINFYCINPFFPGHVLDMYRLDICISKKELENFAFFCKYLIESFLLDFEKHFAIQYFP